MVLNNSGMQETQSVLRTVDSYDEEHRKLAVLER